MVIEYYIYTVGRIKIDIAVNQKGSRIHRSDRNLPTFYVTLLTVVCYMLQSQ